MEELKEPLMSSEDYAYFSKAVSSSFFFVGISPDGNEVIHHNPNFQWNDKNLYTSVCVMAQSAIDFLNEKE